MGVRPLGDRVLLKRIEPEDKTKSSLIYIPEVAKERPQQAEVMAIGPGMIDNGERLPMNVEVGEMVLIGKFTGQDIEIEDVLHCIVREGEILAVLD